MTTRLTPGGVLFADESLESSALSPVRAIFGYGGNSTFVSVLILNLVNNYGGVATDTTGVGTGRYGLAAASYSS
jgi:hypothetical protein